nr:ThiF family adenylyltransferase [Subtercola boreus]
MSTQLFAHSQDLQRLRADGYAVTIQSGHLIVGHVPYVTSTREVAYGTIISELTTSGSSTVVPQTHVVHFAGGTPCDDQGHPLTKVVIQVGATPIADGLIADCMFSSKPPSGAYADYHEKIVRYANMLVGYAQAIDPDATARIYPPVSTDSDDSVFEYLDSASARAGITTLTDRLRCPSVAIVGLGGTGSFILDLIAKTPITEIHLFDSDEFLAHNAFRAPGAASLAELDARPKKVDYFARIYSKMRRGITPHPVRVDGSNADVLLGMSFVFIAIDSGSARHDLVEALERMGIPFIDVGMGIDRQGEQLGGMLRVTTSTVQNRKSAREPGRLPFADADDDLYRANIQVADMNALNAVLAVSQWKQYMEFYANRGGGLYITYTIATGQLLRDQHHPEISAEEGRKAA